MQEIDNSLMDYPTMQDVNSATLDAIAKWYHGLPAPENIIQGLVLRRIVERYSEVGRCIDLAATDALRCTQ